MSHTHAGPNANSQLRDKPGVELIQPYLDHLTDQIGAAVEEAIAALEPAWVTYGHGRCALADEPRSLGCRRRAIRLRLQPRRPRRRHAARRTGHRRRGAIVRATLFNYACHPTTLAWENRLLSPDYIGAAREVLESAFGAPALFLQGASGELAPRDDYVGDAAVADRNGRQLGHAAAAAIESLPPPGTRFVYTGIVASGANLGTWEYRPCERGAARRERPPGGGADARRARAQGGPRCRGEPHRCHARRRYRSARRPAEGVPRASRSARAPPTAMPLWTWRLGEALLVAVPNEPYSDVPDRAATPFEGSAGPRPDDDERRRRLSVPRETYGSGPTRSSSRRTRRAASSTLDRRSRRRPRCGAQAAARRR